MNKDQLRARMRAVRSALVPQELESAGHRVAERLLAGPELARPTRVLVYLSVRRELPTRDLVRRLVEAGHTVAVPHVLGGGLMEARALREPLVRGVLDIPTSEGPVVDDIEVALVPGLAFDAAGRRLGYGAGHYDRWLASHRPRAVGVGTDAQLVPWVPTEVHDRAMDRVVTPSTEVVVRAPVRVSAGAWVRGGRVYAVRRAPHRPRGGAWELPGGKVERGEEVGASLVRELREELGIGAAVVGPLARAVHAYDDVTVELDGWLVRSDDTPRLTEHDAERWLAPHELDDVAWAPADLPLIDALKRHFEDADIS